MSYPPSPVNSITAERPSARSRLPETAGALCHVPSAPDARPIVQDVQGRFHSHAVGGLLAGDQPDAAEGLAGSLAIVQRVPIMLTFEGVQHDPQPQPLAVQVAGLYRRQAGQVVNDQRARPGPGICTADRRGEEAKGSGGGKDRGQSHGEGSLQG